MGGPAAHERRVVADLLSPGDKVVLVVPIDSSAPKGRIILPQQLVLRDVLDAHASAMVCQPGELAGLLAAVHDVRLVITDSQAFQKVASIVPETTPLTSFSLLMARYKGDLRTLVEGAAALGALTDESRVLISEGCTHHRQCEDIGTVKMPAWIRGYCGANPTFEFTQGHGGALRRVHAQREGDALATERGGEKRYAHGELRRGNRLRARHLGAQLAAAYVMRVRIKGRILRPYMEKSLLLLQMRAPRCYFFTLLSF